MARSEIVLVGRVEAIRRARGSGPSGESSPASVTMALHAGKDPDVGLSVDACEITVDVPDARAWTYGSAVRVRVEVGVDERDGAGHVAT